MSPRQKATRTMKPTARRTPVRLCCTPGANGLDDLCAACRAVYDASAAHGSKCDCEPCRARRRVALKGWDQYA